MTAIFFSLGSMISTMPGTAQQRTDFKVAWSIYVGWMPWGYIEDS
ncbi:MAG: lipid kinase, partial [Pseudomonadota bacterium]